MIELDEMRSVDLMRALLAVDPATLGRSDLLESIAGWERVRSHVQACQNDAFVAWERLTTPARRQLPRCPVEPPRVVRRTRVAVEPARAPGLGAGGPRRR